MLGLDVRKCLKLWERKGHEGVVTVVTCCHFPWKRKQMKAVHDWTLDQETLMELFGASEAVWWEVASFLCQNFVVSLFATEISWDSWECKCGMVEWSLWNCAQHLLTISEIHRASESDSLSGDWWVSLILLQPFGHGLADEISTRLAMSIPTSPKQIHMLVNPVVPPYCEVRSSMVCKSRWSRPCCLMSFLWFLCLFF